MKGIILICCFTLTLCSASFAQRFAYVNTDYIFKHMPEYASAEKQLSALADQWQKEVDNRFGEVDKLNKALQADQVLMTPEMKKRKEAEIVEKEKAAKNFQLQKFGPQGELATKSSSVIKPIQDRVEKAIEALAESESLDFVLDKNGEVIMLYANPRYDKSDEVLKRLGLKPGNTAK